MVERNPSPPREFEVEHGKFRQDMIGDTAISKKWVYTTLMDMCKEVEKHSEKDDMDAVDISDELQDEACKLWDLCIEKDLACFLIDTDALKLLCSIIARSMSPRLTEITVGVLGNIACTHEACDNITNDGEIPLTILSLLSCRDSPTLVEVGRLINTCLAEENSKDTWLDLIESSLEEHMEDICFILNSSTNSAVLKNIVEMLDICLDSRSTLIYNCLGINFMNSIAEAGLQLAKDDDSCRGVGNCLHILNILTSEEEKAFTFFKNNTNIFKFASNCCEKWECMENFNIGTNPTAVSVASCLSVINFILDTSTASDEKSTFLDDVHLLERKNISNLTGMVKNYCTTTSHNQDTVPKQDPAESNGAEIGEKDDHEQSQSDDKSINANSVANVNGENVNQLFDNVPLLDVANDLLITLNKLKWRE